MMNKSWLTIAVVALSVLQVGNALSNDFVRLEQAHKRVKLNKYAGIDSMLVYHKGLRISEHYYGRFTSDTLHRTHSTFKSISALISFIAIEQGLLTFDEPVMPLLERFRGLNDTDTRKQKITVNHLLNMTSGLSCDESPDSQGPNHEFGIDEGETPLEYAMEIKMVATPGEKFQYCNANSFLLTATISAALDKANRENIFEFADKFLMRSLGINNYRFTKSYSGQFLNGQGNAYFSSRDLAKFGLLLMNGGQWQGKTLISKSSLKRIFKPTHHINWSFLDLVENLADTPSGYSNQWYTSIFNMNNQSIEVIHSWGNGGQFIFVIPSLQSVVVFTGSNQGNFVKQKQTFDILHKYILPELISIFGE